MNKVVPLLVVDDVQRSAAFYVQGLGFTQSFIYPADQPQVAMVSLDGIQLLLETPASYEQKSGVILGLGLRGQGVELQLQMAADLDSYYLMVTSRQVEVIRPLFTTDYGMRQFTIRDVNSYVLTFIQHCPEGPAE